jgi:hypothetical protein
VAVHRVVTSRSHKFSCTQALHYREICLRSAAENAFARDDLRPRQLPHGHFSSNQILSSEPLLHAYQTFRRTRPYWSHHYEILRFRFFPMSMKTVIFASQCSKYSQHFSIHIHNCKFSASWLPCLLPTIGRHTPS